MSYPDPDDKCNTPHLDAMCIGLLAWIGGAAACGLISNVPSWVHMLIAFAVLCWVTGWVLRFLWKGLKWFWKLLGRLEIDYD